MKLSENSLELLTICATIVTYNFEVTVMINELLYMETRVFSEFCKMKNIPAKEANQLFKTCGIWDYIESCYETLRMNGDTCVLDDVERIMKKQGVAI